MSLSKTRIKEILSVVGEQFTLDELASKLNISATTAKKYLQILVKHGYIEKSDSTYRVTERAKSLMERDIVVGKKVDEKYSYIFTDSRGNPIPLKIDSLVKLYVAIKYQLIPESIVMDHVRKGYLSTWIREQLGASILSTRIHNAKSFEELLSILEDYVEN